MKLLHASSLPIPHIDLVGPAEQLTELHHEFLVDDLTSCQSPVSATGRFETPWLSVLSKSGVHFRDAYVVPRWKPLSIPSLTKLAIIDYQSCNGPFPFIDLLTYVAGVCKEEYLKFGNLQLDCAYTGPGLPYNNLTTSAVWQPSTYFVGMDADTLVHYSRLLGWSYSPDISYARCTTPVPRNVALATAACVSFSDIHDPAVLVSLLKAVSDPGEGGYSLSFKRCSGLREVLRELGNPLFSPRTRQMNVHARGCLPFLRRWMSRTARGFPVRTLVCSSRRAS